MDGSSSSEEVGSAEGQSGVCLLLAAAGCGTCCCGLERLSAEGAFSWDVELLAYVAEVVLGVE